MLVDPTVTELLKKADNRFRLVVASSKRARQIFAGSKPMVNTDDTAPVSIAANEINAGDLKIYDEEQWKELQKNVITSDVEAKEKTEE